MEKIIIKFIKFSKKTQSYSHAGVMLKKNANINVMVESGGKTHSGEVNKEFAGISSAIKWWVDQLDGRDDGLFKQEFSRLLCI